MHKKVRFILCLGIFALINAIFMSLTPSGLDFSWAQTYGYRYLDGLLVTVRLVLVAFLLGMAVSIGLYYLGQSPRVAARAFNSVYISVFRGTPLLAQVFFIYYGIGSFSSTLQSLGLWWLFRDAWFCGLLALALNTAAYQAVILESGIASVPTGQMDAAKSLGLGRLVAFSKIILPQAMITSIRSYGNEIILLMKGSAVISVITVLDLMGQTRYAFSKTFNFQAYIWAAILYLLVVEIIRITISLVEDLISPHMRAPPVQSNARYR